MIESYLSFCREIRLLRPKTLKEYRYIILKMGGYIDYKNPGSQSDIEAKILQAKKAGDWSQSYTAKVSAGVLIPWFAWLSEQNYISFNPYIHNRFKKERPEEPDFYTQEEFDSILNNPMLSWQDQTLLRIAWDTGMRKSEILSMNQEDVDLKEKIIFVKNSKGGYSDGRSVPFTDSTKQYIEKQIEWIRENKIFDAVFVDCDWNRLGESSCDKRIREIGNMTTPLRGACRFHLHALRHSFANRALNAGLDQLTVMKILGHSSLAMTNLYLHHSTSDVKKAYEKMLACG